MQVIRVAKHDRRPGLREPADVDCSGEVDATDLGTLLAAWGASDGPADLDGNRTVDATDLAKLLAAWGPVD